MRFCVLGSGSKGNATYVEADGVKLLIDSGFSGVEIERRLTTIGVDAALLNAIIVTHEHGDHIRGVPILSRRFKLPVYVSRATMRAAGKSFENLHEWQEIAAGSSFNVLGLEIHPFSISHDAVDPMGFVISNSCCSLGYCTDTGVTSRLMQHRLSNCHGLVLEFNHDPEMLKNSHYPPYLQQRVRGKSGHLANDDALDFLRELIHTNLQHVVLAHISESNNHPEIIRRTIEPLLTEVNNGGGGGLTITLAEQDRVGDVVILSGCDLQVVKS